MKRLALAIVSILLLAASAESRTKLKYSCGDAYDWGKVSPGDSPLKAEIKIYNNRRDTLRIRRVKPTCGCTTAPLDKKVIAPGDSATLKVTLNVKQYEGEVFKKIIVASNRGTDYLGLKANVFIPLKIFPNNYFNFGRMYVGDTTVTKIVINNKSEQDITITSLEKKPDSLNLNMVEGTVIKKDSLFTLAATVAPDKPGHYNCKIRMTTDHPDQPSLIVSGWGKISKASEKKKDYQSVNPKLEKPEQGEGKVGVPVEKGPASSNPQVKPQSAPNANPRLDPKQNKLPTVHPKSSPKTKIKVQHPQNSPKIQMREEEKEKKKEEEKEEGEKEEEKNK